MATRIIDVAKVAGVSRTTASDALRGEGRVSEATRVAVMDAAQRLGYSMNRTARSLRTATTGTIGLYIPQVLIRSEHYLSVVYGAVNEAARFDYDVTLIVAGDESRRNYTPHADGIVIIDPVEDDPMVQRLMDSRLPVVTSERFPSGRQSAGAVWSDHGREARRLLDHLADRGARRPALIASVTKSDWATGIIESFRSWCAARGVEPTMIYATFGGDPEIVREETRRLLDAHPEIDALVCASDGVAAAVVPTITAAGRSIGSDLLLASCVDSTTLSVLSPPVTAIDTRGGEAGSACARLLLQLLNGEEIESPTIELPLELLIRDSTAGPVR